MAQRHYISLGFARVDKLVLLGEKVKTRNLDYIKCVAFEFWFSFRSEVYENVDAGVR